MRMNCKNKYWYQLKRLEKKELELIGLALTNKDIYIQHLLEDVQIRISCLKQILF